MSSESSKLHDIQYADIELPSQHPQIIYATAAEIDKSPETMDCFQEDYAVLWRGDTLAQYKDMERFNEVSREFPIYFTTSKEEAIGHANRKKDEGVLMRIEAPYESIQSLPYPKKSIEKKGENLSLEPNTVYLEGSDYGANTGRHHILSVAQSIPKEWVELEYRI